jgi:hypothetical protein
MAKNDNAVLKFPAVIISFPTFDKPRAFEEGQAEKYECTILLSRKNDLHIVAYENMQKEIKKLQKATWPKGVPPRFKMEFFGKGEDRTNQETEEIYDGYKGTWWVKGKCNNPPALFSKDGGILEEIVASDPRLRAGMVANVTMNLYVPKPNPQKKIGAMICMGLRGVQALGRGTPFGNTVSEKEFEDFDDEDTDDDEDDDEDDGL